jgi:hypothetical protein
MDWVMWDPAPTAAALTLCLRVGRFCQLFLFRPSRPAFRPAHQGAATVRVVKHAARISRIATPAPATVVYGRAFALTIWAFNSPTVKQLKTESERSERTESSRSERTDRLTD